MKNIVKGILAGCLISIGCIIYSACENKFLGAFLFSFGLFCIVSLGLNLYTGKIGYLVEKFNVKYGIELINTLLGNFIGTVITAEIFTYTRMAPKVLNFVQTIVETKNTDNLISLFILSVFCGILMYLGVEIHRSSENPVSRVLAIVFAVSIFILAGFEHCVANMFYMVFAQNIDIGRLFIMIFGNSVGSLLFAGALKYLKDKEKNI